MIIEFTKAEGAKNDFVIIDDRERRLDADMRRRLAREMCERRTGVGSDGLIVIENSDRADFTMCFHNPDGSVGAMCGNGGRCAVVYSHEHGIAPDPCTFVVLDRIYSAHMIPEGVHLDFPPPRSVSWDRELVLDDFMCLLDAPIHIRYQMIDTGAPHAIVMVESLPAHIAASIHDLPVDELGAAIRNHKAFTPDGTNVTFMTVQNVVHIRTFERGVEAETMACGTGTLAAAIAANVLAGVQSPVTLRTRGGDTLVAGLDPAGSGPANPGLLPRDMYLEGPARLVYTGRWIVDSDTAMPRSCGAQKSENVLE